MKFKQHAHLTGAAPDGRRIVIDFSPLPRRARDPACGARESEGRAFIAPETMRLRRIEVRTSDYEILPNLVGEWDWSAEYGSVLFDGKPFWLPHTIESMAIPYGHPAWPGTSPHATAPATSLPLRRASFRALPRSRRSPGRSSPATIARKHPYGGRASL